MPETRFPNIHHETANRIVAELSKDSRIAGVAAGGSWLATMDEYSDLDLVIAARAQRGAATKEFPKARGTLPRRGNRGLDDPETATMAALLSQLNSRRLDQ